MRPQIDDTLLTAYALGELDAVERARVDAHLATDADARRFVAEVRESAALLTGEFRREAAAFRGLTALHHAAIERRLHDVERAASPRAAQHARPAALRIRRWVPLAASVAASVAIIAGAVAFLLPRLPLQQPAVSESGTGESTGSGAAGTSGLVVLGPDEGIRPPALPGDNAVAGADTLAPLPDGSEAPGDLANLDDSAAEWEPVEGMRDPREFQAERLANRRPAPEPRPEPQPKGQAKDEPRAEVKVARGPAHSPEAEVVRPDTKPPTPPRNPRGRGPEGVYVSPPRDREAFDRIVKRGAAPDVAHRILENPFRPVAQRPRSAFPVRVQTTSYRAVRADLLEGRLPPAHRVRIEELVNRFAYRHPSPSAEGPPVTAGVEVATCPWNVRNRLARVAVAAHGEGSAVVARGVEVSVEFNPLATAAWRLIGYENAPPAPGQPPALAADLAPGAAATALYEIVPATAEPRPASAAAPKELFTLHVRYTDPRDATGSARPLRVTAADDGRGFDRAGDDFRFATAVAAFGMLLRDSQFKGDATYADVVRWAKLGRGPDETGERAEFIDLAKRALEAAGTVTPR